MKATFMHVGMEVETTQLKASRPNLGIIESDYLDNRAPHIPGTICAIPDEFCGEVAYVCHPNGVPQNRGQGPAMAAYLSCELDPPEV